jgi:heptosyltransferase-2
MNKILIVGPAWIGDMVMAQSLFKLLKIEYPHASIDVLAPGWSLPILKRMPEVTAGIAMPLGHGQLNLKARYQLGKTLGAATYDTAIVLPNSFKSALIPFWAKIPVRIGWRGEMRYVLLNDIRILNAERYPLMIERFMALGLKNKADIAKPYPHPSLHFSTQTQTDVLTKYGLSNTAPILALCPGAEFGPAKRWPENYYAEVARQKMAEGWQVWILGSAKDGPVAEKIMEETGQKCVNLTGRTDLVEAIDLLSLSKVVLTNDSGLMHIAAAVNTPILAIYGPTSTGFTPPLHPKAQVLQLNLPCQPCFQRECPLLHHRCMQDLKPVTVLQTLEGLC